MSFSRAVVHSRQVVLSMEEILNCYYENNARKLRGTVDKILHKFGGISDRDYHDFYSIANEVFVDVMRRYDGEQSFDGFLYACLSKRFKTEITSRNRLKRISDRYTISIDMAIGDDENSTIGDMLPSDFNMDIVMEREFRPKYDGNLKTYFNSINEIQRQILEMKMENIPVSEIKERLNLSNKQYAQHWNELKAFEKISVLYGNANPEVGEDTHMQVQTMEKSKPDRLSISSIIKKIDKHTIRFDHPLQRESEQWSPSMKGNLISDILQGNPIPPLVFAEQVVNGIAIIWDLDGKQRCTNAYSFSKDGYRISRNISRYMIEYQSPVLDEKGNTVFDKENFPIYKKKEFDIRGKKYSELPEELQDKFNDYNFEIVQYLNCSSEDIAYHIARYNEGKPMTASQKGITRLGEEYAGMVKAISSMSFFRDMGGYKVSEFKNGTINRVVVESLMAVNFLEDWKKKQEDMCEYIKKNANSAMLDHFEGMIGRLERVITDNVSDMFNSKDSFLWFGLFARFIQSETDDRKFIYFMEEFARSLHSKKIKSVSFDDLNGKSTKDKSVVIAKMEHLEKLMYKFLGANKDEAIVDDILSFVRENVNKDVTQEDIALYKDCLDDLTVNVDNNTRLLDRQNRTSLIAIIAYLCDKDIYMDNWFKSFFKRHDTYINDQKENYLYMVKDINRYFTGKSKESA